MHSTSLIAACLLSLALAACAVDAGRREPEQPRRVNPVPAKPRSETPPPAPVAPLQRQPAPARIPYQLILPPPLPAPPPAPAGPQTPVPLTTCDPGGCWNTGAGRYNGGTGDTFLDRGGRQCVRNGAWMQCF